MRIGEVFDFYLISSTILGEYSSFLELEDIGGSSWFGRRVMSVVSRTRAENQMETCGVHLDGTLFLPAQGRTPGVPVKAAKRSHAER